MGITDRVNIPKIVQQGGTWGPVLCSNSMDTIGKKCRDRGDMHFLYKNTVQVLPLAMVDDLIGISKCGIGLDFIELNTFMNIQIELKKLKFHVPDKDGKTKCHKILGPGIIFALPWGESVDYSTVVPGTYAFQVFFQMSTFPITF